MIAASESYVPSSSLVSTATLAVSAARSRACDSHALPPPLAPQPMQSALDRQPLSLASRRQQQTHIPSLRWESAEQRLHSSPSAQRSKLLQHSESEARTHSHHDGRVLTVATRARAAPGRSCAAAAGRAAAVGADAAAILSAGFVRRTHGQLGQQLPVVQVTAQQAQPPRSCDCTPTHANHG